MSEFKFQCPACKQDIVFNPTIVGERINCPHCLTLVLVPPAIATPGSSAAASAAIQKTSGLAIASLVCSLASAVTCIGWLPGVICGHIARAKIRRDPALKGDGIALAGLVIGYLFLVSEVSFVGVKVWRISAAVKKGFTDVRHQMATNHMVVITDTSSNIEDVTLPEPGPATDDNLVPANGTADSNWKTDPATMTFPDHPVSGKIHGNDFTLRRAVAISGGIRLVSANRLVVEVHGLGTDIGGKSFEVHPKDAPNKIPHVQMTWPEGVLEPAAAVARGYAMKLEFSQANNGTISGKIYVCLPDNSKSWLAGTFDAQLPKANTPSPAN